MITVNHDAAFTWDTANFRWDDPAAGKTWDTAYTAHYTLAPTEPLTITITDKRASRITSQETAHLTRTTTRQSTRTTITPIALGENAHRITTFARSAGESLTASENAHRNTALPLSSHIDCAERTSTKMNKVHRRSLTTTEEHTHRADYRRTTEEVTRLIAENGRSVARTSCAHLTLTDTYLSPWQGTLSSITMLTSGLDDSTWARISDSPSGYEAFHPFDVGEYTYRDALVRLLLTTGAAGADPLLYDVAFHIDIEDTRESGIADCTAEEATRITLKHHYYHPPRIVLTVLSADTAAGVPIPHLIGQSEQDGTHTFDCELLLEGGTRTSGTISWLAEGY